MSNPANFGVLTGRLAADPKFFSNSDNSATVKLSVYVRNNYKSKDGQVASQRVDVQRYIDASGRGAGVYQIIGQGDLVSINFAVKTNDYVDSSGQKIYGQILEIDNVQILESKSVTSARHNRNDSQNQQNQSQQQNNQPNNAQFNQQPQAPQQPSGSNQGFNPQVNGTIQQTQQAPQAPNPQVDNTPFMN